MPPVFAVDNARDVAVINEEHGCDFSLVHLAGLIQAPNLPHHVGGKSSSPTVLASRRRGVPSPPFSYAIGSVIPGGTLKQVSWIEASRRVAGVM